MSLSFEKSSDPPRKAVASEERVDSRKVAYVCGSVHRYDA